MHEDREFEEKLAREIDERAERVQRARRDHVERSITRGRRRQAARMIGGGLAAAAVLAVAGGALMATGDERSTAPNEVAAGVTSSPSPEPAANKDCPYVEAEPTYLPWVPQGEEIPEPRRVVEGGTSYVAWIAEGSEGPEQKSLVLRRSSEPLGGTGEPVSVELEGAPGYYYDGPGAQGAVLWKTEAKTCGLITLTLSLPRASGADAREELLKVVESLES